LARAAQTAIEGPLRPRGNVITGAPGYRVKIIIRRSIGRRFREAAMPVVVRVMVLVGIAAIALGAAAPARAFSTREEPAAPAAGTTGGLDAAQKKIDAGDYPGAIPILTDFLKANPNNADALNLMGFSLRKTGQTNLALQYYIKALSLSPKHLGANEYLGELYVETGQIDKAKERLAVLRGACGNCEQAQDLSAAIDKAQKTHG
jgi:predicted Zn-dependent protease